MTPDTILLYVETGLPGLIAVGLMLLLLDISICVENGDKHVNVGIVVFWPFVLSGYLIRFVMDEFWIVLMGAFITTFLITTFDLAARMAGQ